MAIINGPLNFTGSLGNMHCYYDPARGIWILAKNGGAKKKRMATLPSLEKARAYARELGGRSKWGSLLKQSLSGIKHLMFACCWGKIMATGKLIQRHDETVPLGNRDVLVSKDPGVLTQIDFNERHPFRSVIRDNFEIDLSSDKRTVTLSIPGFIPANDAWWVTKYLAVRLHLVVAQTADMVWNPVTQKYEPVVPDLELLTRKVVSGWMYNNNIPVDVILSVLLADPAFSIPGTVMVVAVGVEFSLSATNGEPNVMPHNGSMAIVKWYTE
jgi:hypothetical protein